MAVNRRRSKVVAGDRFVFGVGGPISPSCPTEFGYLFSANGAPSVSAWGNAPGFQPDDEISAEGAIQRADFIVALRQ